MSHSIGSHFLTQIVEASDDAIVSTDLDGVVLSWNPAAQRLFGLTPREAVGRRLDDVFPGQHSLLDALVRAAATGVPIRTDHVLRQDEQDRLLTLTGSPMRDENGTVCAVGITARDITERHKLDLMARRLALVIESSDDAIVTKTLDSTIQTWNPSAERMFGYSAAEAIGRSIRIIIPEDRQHEEDHVLGEIRAGRPVRHYETIRRRKDGSLIPISLTVSPLRDAAGVIVGASKIARDISDRAQADLAARRLAAVVESSDDAIVTKDLNSVITSWNKGAHSLFGYTAEEAIGQSIRMLIPPDLQSEEDMVLTNIRAGRAVDHYETRRLRKDGSEVAISLTVSPLFDAHGTVVGASKIARDITDRVRLEEKAREEAKITRQLNDIGRVVAGSLDRNAIVQKVTDVATELTQAEFGAFFYNAVQPDTGETLMLYTLSGAPKEAFEQFPHPRATAIFAPTFHGVGTVCLDDVKKDPRYGQNPPFNGMPEGHLPVSSYLAVPVKSPAGEVMGGLFFGHSRAGVFKDHHARLAEGAAMWAAVALQNARLYQDARQADRLKDEFLAVLSHELRTPLNAIVGYSRLLRTGVLVGEKAERGIETVERNASALTRIVEDVLDISRIISGKIRLEVQPVDLSLVVHNAVATMKPAADAKGVRLHTILDPLVGHVSGDPDRLQQVVWNLLANAVKFTPKRGRVQVRLERVNSHVEIVVSDTGIGIKPEFLGYVFDRFRQAEGVHRDAGGLGLGLSIVRHIVELHGGTVHVASEGVGKGATFRVALPPMAVQVAAGSETREHPRTETGLTLGPLADLRGVRVVAIDDEPEALNLLRAVLEASGAVVTTIQSAAEAVSRLPALEADVFIVDLGMPVMDGFQFISTLRASTSPLRRVPAAALTAFARAEDRTRALQSGFEMHLAKPIDPAELAASVLTLVRRGREF